MVLISCGLGKKEKGATEMIAKKDFLKKYNVSEDSFEKTKLDWDQLKAIYDAYVKILPTLEPYLTFFAECLRRAPKVHSIKARLKDPEHLIEKIIRQKQEDPGLEITTENFRTVITDVIGLRALHLFKEDWELVHENIIKSWEIKSKPVANIREGDQKEITRLFQKKGCEVKKHPFGYRSVHYLIVSKPVKEEIIAEIQVRTIFEEGWSEIDHLIRYPYMKANPILEQYLVLFNRLAGSADEMGSYIKYLDSALRFRELEFKQAIQKETEKNKELQKKIGELEAKIEEMKIDRKDKASLKLDLERISDITTSMPDYSDIMSKLVPKVPDYSDIMSNLVPKVPDYSDIMSNLVPKMPDYSDITAPTTNLHDTSSPIINEDLGGTADKKSTSSDEEDKTDDDKHKKNEEEKNSV